MITSDFVAYALRVSVVSASPVSPELVRDRLVALMNAIASECDKAGSTLIGHIKCVLDAGDKGFLAVSTTDASGHATVRGELKEGVNELNVIINVLLYGLARIRVQGIVDPLAREFMAFDGAQVHLEDLDKKEAPTPIRIGGLDDKDHC